MNYINIAEKILELSGGKENIVSNVISKGKLSIKVKELEKVELDRFMEIGEIVGVTTSKDSVVDILIDSDKSDLIGERFLNLTGIREKKKNKKEKELKIEKKVEKEPENEGESSSKEKGKIGVISKFSMKIVNIFEPLIPALIAAGFLKGIINIVDILPEGEIYKGFWWYQLLKTIGWGAFTYLPVLVCLNTVKEFKGTPALGGVIGTLAVRNSLMPLLLQVKGYQILLPITEKTYVPEMGGILIIVIVGIMTAYIERVLRKITPKFFSDFFPSLMTLCLSALFFIYAVQPLGELLTKQIFSGLYVIFEQIEAFGGFILAAVFIPLTSLGLHHTLAPIHEMLVNPDGPTAGLNYILPIFMMAYGGQAGGALAIFFKTKNKKLKKLIRNSFPLALLGIGEPLVYTVTFPLIVPFITSCIGGGIGGIMAGFFNLGTRNEAILGAFGFLTAVKGTAPLFLASMAGAVLGGFILTYFIGVNKKRIEEVY